MRGCLQWSNSVGLRDGTTVGALGLAVGLVDGASVASLGDSDGLAEGETVGLVVGLALGTSVGATVEHVPTLPGSEARHASASSGAGAVHALEPAQSESTQQSWPVLQPGHDAPQSTSVSRSSGSNTPSAQCLAVGDEDGDSDGLCDGVSVGLADGNVVGDSDGYKLGLLDGANVEHAPRLPGIEPPQGKSGLLQTLDPSQSESKQHPASNPHAGHAGPPQSTSVSLIDRSITPLLHSTIVGELDGDTEGRAEGHGVGLCVGRMVGAHVFRIDSSKKSHGAITHTTSTGGFGRLSSHPTPSHEIT